MKNSAQRFLNIHLISHMKMNKVVIPILLSLTVVIAGIFAFIPVQEAATVHTVVMANTMRMDEINLAATAADQDLIITCPATSDGCRILELYMQENGAGDIELGALTANITTSGGVNQDFIIQADVGTVIDGGAEAIAGISGSVFGPGDTLTLEIVDDDSDSATYNAIIFIEVEGNTIATAEFT